MKLDDELLIRALAEARGRALSELPEEPEVPHVFSADFEQKMERLIRAEGKPRWRRRMNTVVRRAAVFLLVSVIGLSACILGVDAWREKFFTLVEEKFPEYSRITFEESGAGAHSENDVIYELGYIPDGFRREGFGLSGFFNYNFYEGGNDHRISFDQNHAESIAIGLNTEGAEMIDIPFKGDTAKFLSNLGMQTVLWYDDRYVFMVTTDLPREEAVRIAESVRPKEHPAPSRQRIPIESLPESYPPEAAAQNGDVVVRRGTTANLDRLRGFIDHVEAGTPDVLRIAFYARGDAPRVKDLEYDGRDILYTFDDSRDDTSDQPWMIGERFSAIDVKPAEISGQTVYEVYLYSEHYDKPTLLVRCPENPD